MNHIAKLFTAALLVLNLSEAYADSGRITLSGGEAQIERDARILAINPNSEIRPGDTISTGQTGRVQWAMQDNSTFSTLGGTQFKIEEFSKFDRPRSIYSLLKGGFRTVTGLISKRADGIYKMNTPVATLGVRGTKYLGIFCKSSCDKYTKSLNGKVEDGLYVKVDEGIVIITNANGSIEVKAGEVGFVPADGSAPRLIASALVDAFLAAVELDFDLMLPGISRPDRQLEIESEIKISPRIQPTELPASPS